MHNSRQLINSAIRITFYTLPLLLFMYFARGTERRYLCPRPHTGRTVSRADWSPSLSHVHRRNPDSERRNAVRNQYSWDRARSLRDDSRATIAFGWEGKNNYRVERVEAASPLSGLLASKYYPVELIGKL